LAIKTSKFGAANNSKAIINALGLEYASYYDGGTNDNALDAQNEIRLTFQEIMSSLEQEFGGEELEDFLYENGVRRRPICFGDPFHIANLVVTWASVFAFGETENGAHRQVHHRQLLMSLHSLRANDAAYAQAKLDEIMEGVDSFTLRTWRERTQRWLVNQRYASLLLEMLNFQTADGTCALVAWALSYANEKDGWLRTVGAEVAMWLQMPELILGLHFEVELGNYFEEVWLGTTGLSSSIPAAGLGWRRCFIFTSTSRFHGGTAR